MLVGEGLLDGLGGEGDAFVDEAGDAPGGGHVDEDGAAFGAEGGEAGGGVGLLVGVERFGRGEGGRCRGGRPGRRGR